MSYLTKPSTPGELMHFGVKGMKWGVRREAKRVAKAEKKWEKKATSTSAFINTHNAAAQRMNDTEIPRINNKPQYKTKDFSKDSPLRRKYYKEYEDTFNRIMVEEHRRLYGTSPSGARKLGIVDGNLQLVDVKHAMEDYELKIEFDANGHIRSMKIVDSSLAQSELVHFGVKGMKWGVRKKPTLAPHPSITAKQHQMNRAGFGKRGAERINEKLHEGKSLKTARLETRAEIRSRHRKQAAIALGLYVAVQVAPLILGSANAKMSNIAAGKMAKNGAKAAQNAFADSRGISNVGVKVVEATFDSAKGIWS